MSRDAYEQKGKASSSSALHPPQCSEAEVTVALLSGLEKVPCGAERLQACGARCTEVMRGIRQIQNVLNDTERDMMEEGDGQGMQKSAQRDLYALRLKWATEMTAGLQKGALALKLLELAELTCEGRHAVAASSGTQGEVEPVYHAVLEKQYQRMLGPLKECQLRASQLTHKLAGVEKSLKEVDQECSQPTMNDVCNFWDGLNHDMGLALMDYAVWPTFMFFNSIAGLVRGLFPSSSQVGSLEKQPSITSESEESQASLDPRSGEQAHGDGNTDRSASTAASTLECRGGGNTDRNASAAVSTPEFQGGGNTDRSASTAVSKPHFQGGENIERGASSAESTNECQSQIS